MPTLEKNQAKKFQGLVGADFEDKFAKAISGKKTAAAQEWLALDVWRWTSRVPASSSSRAPVALSSRARAILSSHARTTASSRLINSHLSRKRKKRGLNMPSGKAQRLNNSTRRSQKTRARLPNNIEGTSSVYENENSTFKPTTKEFDPLTSLSHCISGHSGLLDLESKTVNLPIIEVSSDDTSNSDTDMDHEGSITYGIAERCTERLMCGQGRHNALWKV